MANLATAITLPNEIVKASDFQFSHDQQFKNSALLLSSLFNEGSSSFILGGTVSPYEHGGMAIQVSPLLVFDSSTKNTGIETEVTSAISVEAAGVLDRIDTVQVCIQEEEYDNESRAFMYDATTKIPVYENIFTKKRIVLAISVKKGAEGAAIAPALDSGCVKLAEISVPAGTVNITASLINNITAKVSGAENTDWTADKKAVFSPLYITQFLNSFLLEHAQDGSHKNAVIGNAALKLGVGSDEINASMIPIGESVALENTTFESLASTKEIIKAIASVLNGTKAYANTMLSRYEYLLDSPIVASTQNIDVALGGELTIDGEELSAGQMVLLKDQIDKKENGLWIVQTGSWNRADGYKDGAMTFEHKLIVIAEGASNEKKAFYLPGENNVIGESELNFTEANFTSEAMERKFVVRDENARAKVAEPESPSDIATKNYVDKLNELTDIHTGGLYAPLPRFLRFCADNKKALIIKKGTAIKVGDNLFFASSDTTFDLSAQVTDAGKDYFVYLNNTSGAWNLTASTTKTADTASSRYIGRFHTLCAAVPSGTTMIAPAAPSSGIAEGDSYLVKSYNAETDADFYDFYNKKVSAVEVLPYYDVVTCEHPLSGFQAGDILPESVWCLTFKPDCRFEDAMVYDRDTGIAADVYLQSGRGAASRSRYNAVHTVNEPHWNHQEDARQVGKRLLSDDEFTSIAIGSNEKTNIAGSKDASTVGGHSDTEGRRMISAIGCEECCGYLYQWLRDVAALGYGSAQGNTADIGSNSYKDGKIGDGTTDVKWITSDGQDSFGSSYCVQTALRAGGYWYHGVFCGSRCRNANRARSSVAAITGCRFSSRVVVR